MHLPPWPAQVSFQFQGCRVTDPAQPASDAPTTYPAGLHPQHVRLHPSPEDVHSSFPPTVAQQKVHVRTACSSERDGMSVGITGTLLLSLCVIYREGCDGVPVCCCEECSLFAPTFLHFVMALGSILSVVIVFTADVFLKYSLQFYTCACMCVYAHMHMCVCVHVCVCVSMCMCYFLFTPHI